MSPWQLSHQWCDNWIVAIGLVKLPHSQQVATCKSLQPWLGAGKVGGELIDNTIAPLSSFDFPADGLANLPVEVNEFNINRLEGPLAGSLDEEKNLIEACGNREVVRGFAAGGHDERHGAEAKDQRTGGKREVGGRTKRCFGCGCAARCFGGSVRLERKGRWLGPVLSLFSY